MRHQVGVSLFLSEEESREWIKHGPQLLNSSKIAQFS